MSDGIPSTTIVLNREVLDILFPEGSEARVQLANAAVQSLVRTSIKPHHLNAEITAVITAAQREAVHEVTLALVKKNWGVDVLTDSGKAIFKREAQSVIDAEIRKAIGECLEKALPNIEAMADKAVSAYVERHIQTKALKAVGDAIGAAMSSFKPS